MVVVVLVDSSPEVEDGGRDVDVEMERSLFS